MIIALTAGFVLGLAVLSLPAFLSSDMFRERLVSRVNRIPGQRLSMEELSIGWLRGLAVRGLRWRDSRRGLDLSVGRLTGDRGLLALLVAPRNLGTLTLGKPELVLPPSVFRGREKGASGQEAAPSPDSAGAGKSPVPRVEQSPFWDNLIINLRLEEGRVLAGSLGQGGVALAERVDLAAALASGSVDYTLTAEVGDGSLAARGRINLPARMDAFSETLVAESRLRVKNVALGPVLGGLRPLVADLPAGEGRITGTMTVKTAGRERIDLLGEIEAGNLALAGGFLGTDHPRFKRLILRLDAGYRGGNRGWLVRLLELTGDPGHLSLTGDSGVHGRDLEFRGRLKLPVLFAGLPGLLRVRPDVRLQEGELEVSGFWRNEEEKHRLSAVVRLPSLRGTVAGQRVDWRRPLDLVFNGTLGAGGIGLDELRLESSFLRLQGRGTKANFELDLAGDLKEAGVELGRLFALPYRAEGPLKMSLRSERLADGSYRFSLHSGIKGFTLRRQEKELLPEHDLTLDLQALFPAGRPLALGPVRVETTGTGWPGRITFTGRELCLGREPGGVGRLSWDLDLERVSRVLRVLALLPPDTAFQGRLETELAGRLNGKRLVIREWDSRGSGLALVREGEVRQVDDLVVRSWRPRLQAPVRVGVRPLRVVEHGRDWLARGALLVDFSSHSLRGGGLSLRSRQVALDLHDLSVGDWRQAGQRMQLQAVARLDGRWLNDVLPQSKTEKGLVLQGPVWVTVDASQSGGRDDHWAARVSLSPGGVRLGGISLSDRSPVRAEIHLRGSLHGQEPLALNRMSLDSGPLLLTGSGILKRKGNWTLNIEGLQQPDWQQVARLIAAFGPRVKMLGGTRNHYTLRLTPGPDRSLLTRSRFTTSFRVDRFQGYGLRGEKLLLPVDLEEGRLHVGLHGQLAGGGVSLDPVLDLGRKPVLLTLPAGRQVLDRVALEQAGIRELLARVHPLFGPLATPSGTVSARVDTFAWPLDDSGGRTARADVTLGVSRIRFTAAGILEEILRLLDAEGRELSLEAGEIDCRLGEGRVTCPPVKILVADSAMTLSGSVGLDRTLDYLLEVPVTRNLVGREAYRLLAGQTVKIPLQGSLDHPDFSRRLLEDVLRNLAGQAAAGALKKGAEQVLPGLLKEIVP